MRGTGLVVAVDEHDEEAGLACRVFLLNSSLWLLCGELTGGRRGPLASVRLHQASSGASQGSGRAGVWLSLTFPSS